MKTFIIYFKKLKRLVHLNTIQGIGIEEGISSFQQYILYLQVIVTLSSVVAFLVNLSIFWIIGNTSPLTYLLLLTDDMVNKIDDHRKFVMERSGGTQKIYTGALRECIPLPKPNTSNIAYECSVE